MSTLRVWFLTAALLASLAGACGSPNTPPDVASDSAATEAGPDAMDAATMMDAAPPTDTPTMMGPDVYDPYNDPDARTTATPITAPNETWTWIPFADALCGDGSPTGIGVNLTNRSRNVLIFMMGGGACWSDVTCFIAQTAANFNTGYHESSFNSDLPALRGANFFDRTDMRNPWRDASFVFVPYCTGDVHGGRRITTLRNNGRQQPVYFVGHRNVEVYLRRLVPTFMGTTRVWLTGSSAGGFGAAVNWDQVQSAFGSGVRVDVVDDSGPPIDSPTLFNQIRPAWNLQFPAGCTGCATSLSAIIDYYAMHLAPGRRFALLSYDHDPTISTYMMISQDQFQSELTMLATGRFDSIPTMKYFIIPGAHHTMFAQFDTITASDGTHLSDWLNAMVSDDADAGAWVSHRP